MREMEKLLLKQTLKHDEHLNKLSRQSHFS